MAAKSQSMESEKTSADDSCSMPDSRSIPQEVRIVLIGKTGCGKSTTGNSILKTDNFETSVLAGSCTQICTLREGVIFDKKVVLIDTPGIFDTKESNDEIQQEILRCIHLSSPGPHAFIFVLNIATRFTEEERKSIQHFIKYFGEDIYRYIIVLFTRKNDLDRHNLSLEKYIEKSDENLKSFIAKCGGGAFAMENTLEGGKMDEQVQELLNRISQNVKNNRGECYTNDMYKKAEREINKIESMKWQENLKTREREFQIIQEKIVVKYQQKADKEREKLERIRDQIREQLEKQKMNTDRIVALKNKIEELKHELKDSQSDTNEHLDELRKQLVEEEAEESKLSQKIKELKKTRDESAERIKTKFHEMCDDEIDKAYKHYTEQQKAKYREEIRKDFAVWPVEMLKQGIKKGIEFISDIFSK